ncbi:MAG: hypothetical protein IK073_06710 [Paludibacteraceae bacterium]|nr:hypothetical protein [Paludibacteraceae bacterium]
MKKFYIVPDVVFTPIQVGHLMNTSVGGGGDHSTFIAPQRRNDVVF